MSLFIAEIPNLRGLRKTGADDFLADSEGGPEKMLDVINNAKRHTPPSIKEVLEGCGILDLTKESDADTKKKALESLANDLQGADQLLRISARDEAIKHLKLIKCQAPSALVDAALARIVQDAKGDDPSQGNTPIFEEVSPWDMPVDGGDLLEELVKLFQRFLILPAHAVVALALWTLHTYVLDAFEVTPYLLITSALMRSGKTRVLEILECVSFRPLKLSDSSAAGIFRIVEKYLPAILLDEADAFLGEHEEMRGLLNDGWQRGGYVLRVVGEQLEPKVFKTFCPKAIAAIGSFAGKWVTVADRSIKIPMRRKLKTERVTRLRQRKVRAETETLRRRLSRWGMDSEASLRDYSPALPDELNDRQQDAWEPLLKIADLVGGNWSEKARKAAIALSEADGDDETSSAQERLLADIRDIFEKQASTEIHSEDLCAHLAKMETRPWPEWKNGKPMTPKQLASQLKPFKIKPKQLWIGGCNKNGYEKNWFEDTWARYLADHKPLDGLGFNGINDLGSKSNTLEQGLLEFQKPSVSDSKQRVLEGLEDGNSAAITPPAEQGAPTPFISKDCKISKGDPCRSCGNPWKWQRGPNLPFICVTCHPPVCEEFTLTI